MDQDRADRADGRRVAAARPGGAGLCLPRPVRAVVFDLDGTLLDTEPAYRTAFHAALGECGWSLPEAGYELLIGLPSTERRVRLPQMLGAAFPVQRFFDAYYRRRADLLRGGVALKPGVAAVLDRLDAAGLACAVATSASAATARAHLQAACLLRRFAVVVSRDDVARGKPAPDSFVRAAALLGVAPQDCLAVEDSHHGITAAHRAGMMVVMVPDLLAPTPESLACCVAVLGGLDELTACWRWPEWNLPVRTIVRACVLEPPTLPPRQP